MTALDRYQRLECDAIWRADKGAQRRDVAVSFRDATLIIADPAGRPVSHWSLTALIRLDDGIPATYTPDPSQAEILEIADDTMVSAIEEVRSALARSRPKRSQLRYWVAGGSFAVAVLLAVIWLPDALLRQTVSALPAAKRADIGLTLARELSLRFGAACVAPSGRAALDRLAARTFGPEQPVAVRVLPAPAPILAVLPGPLVIISEDLLSVGDDPAVVAGALILAKVRRAQTDPLTPLLIHGGLSATVRLLVSGDVPAQTLQSYAAGDLTLTSDDLDPERLAAAFNAADIPAGPFLTAIDSLTGSMPLIADTGPPAANALILTDGDWVALQNICNG